MRLRGCPPIMPNLPPAYTVPPLTASDRTVSLAFGFHAVAAPVVKSSAATFLRSLPPTLMKRPPTYTTPVLTATVFTQDSALGFHAVAVASLRFRAAR